jgi:glycosyltransferase involved in cell wall biosynthesis
MNILFTAYYTSEIGGGETSFINLINYLSYQEENHNLTIIVPQIGLFTKKLDKKINIIVASSYLQILCIKDNYELAIHNYMNFGKKFLFLPFLKIGKHSFICHGMWDIPKYTQLNLLKIKSADLFCVNQELFNTIKYENKKILNLGVNINELNIVKNETDIVNIGIIGRFQDIKNQLFGLEVFENIYKKHNNIQLFFIGDTAFTEHSKEYKNKVVNKVNKSNITNIFFVGNKETDTIFDNIDIVFVSSKYESFGMVVIEALTNGIICLAPNIGGPKEIMTDKLEDYLYMPDDVRVTSKKLISIVSNLSSAKEIFNKNKIFYKEKYDIKNTAKTLLGCKN